MNTDRYAFLDTVLNFPEMDFQIKEENGKLSIFDTLRKKFLVLTPEEWVRQHMVQFLIKHRDYPKSLFAMEKGVQYNSLQKRYDILVHNRMGNPFLLIECKAPHVPLSQKTVEQICVYNKVLQSTYIGVSNGQQHLFLSFDLKKAVYRQILEIPQFT